MKITRELNCCYIICTLRLENLIDGECHCGIELKISRRNLSLQFDSIIDHVNNQKKNLELNSLVLLEGILILRKAMRSQVH